ncbi:hypothetical protein NC796_19600 [Aliifodinibius sp. S!AR15-10]|uniref:hypothetical protein n=1 Tax=Aliifodinibius sp. S!AR15-10 TaxID=2950437 RepID=UPI00285B053A|nr:hypothetical protein [Aliifodinibius sp. S!AR15-10]MDR8393369.1 hypothetical protein [Aliifodinibius sp. S!AR15-10]
MSRNKDITTRDLNKALRQISRDARRKNKALGLETMYERDGYLVRLDASGKEHRVKKLERKRRTSPPKVIEFD